ncbi:MAG: hypothetical protein ABIH27_00025 [Candidatus Omnitrophota bacterium]
MKSQRPILEYALLAVVIIIAAGLIFRIKTQDVELCRSALTGLIKGSFSAGKNIDWNNLKAMGVDVGTAYSKFTSDKDRNEYKKGMIWGFKAGFIHSKGRLKEFKNWRVLNKDNGKTVIAVDYLNNKTLLFTLSSQNKRKIIAINWKE